MFIGADGQHRETLDAVSITPRANPSGVALTMGAQPPGKTSRPVDCATSDRVGKAVPAPA